MKLKVLVLAAVLLLFTPGCVSEAVKQNIAKGVAAHDRYTTLTVAALQSKLEGEEARNNINADVAATPRPVLVLLNRLMKSVWISKGNWYAIQFNVLDGPDPAAIEGLTDAPVLAVPGP